MSEGFHDPLVTTKVAPPSERSTGLVFAAMSLLVAFLFRHTAWVLVVALVAAAAFAALSFAAPRLLGPLNRFWFGVSMVLHRIVNPVIMFLMFAIAFVPAGYLMRRKRDPLGLKRRPDLSTYWIDRQPAEGERSLRNQF